MAKNLKFLLILIFILTSCSGFKEAGKVLRNEKIRTTDEFLVEKRNPLVLPPNYKELPVPGSNSEKKENQQEKIKKILKAPQTDQTQKNVESSIEESILNRIRK